MYTFICLTFAEEIEKHINHHIIRIIFDLNNVILCLTMCFLQVIESPKHTIQNDSKDDLLRHVKRGYSIINSFCGCSQTLHNLYYLPYLVCLLQQCLEIIEP